MEIRASLDGISVDYPRHKTIISFAVDKTPAEIEDAFYGMKNKVLKLNISEYSKKHSQEANSYFHILCREIGNHKDINKSETFIKNKMIAISGQPDLDENGNIWTITSNLPLDKMWEQEQIHVIPLDVKLEDDKTIYSYGVMRHIRTYTVKEMSRLIESTVEECKELGIPTISDKEMEKMLKNWKGQKK